MFQASKVHHKIELHLTEHLAELHGLDDLPFCFVLYFVVDTRGVAVEQ